MLNRLRLEDGFSGVNNTNYDYKERCAYSRALWGIYCFERYTSPGPDCQALISGTDHPFFSISAFEYMEPSLVRRPTIPRWFANDASVDPRLMGNGENKDPPLSVRVFGAMCDLSDLLYRVMDYNSHHSAELNTDFDIDSRLAFHRELLEFRDGLPTALRAEINFTLETYCLR